MLRHRLSLVAAVLAVAACAPLAAQNAQLAARESELEARVDSAQAGTLHTPKMRKEEARIAEAAYQLDSLKGVHRLIAADLAALGADTSSVPAVAVTVPPLPVDSSARSRRIHPLVFIGAVAAAAEVGGRLDRDPGGYDRQRFYGGKFRDHFTTGCGVQLAASAAHVPRWLSLPVIALAAVRVERLQGYPNRRDVANGIAGAATCAAWSYYFRFR